MDPWLEDLARWAKRNQLTRRQKAFFLDCCLSGLLVAGLASTAPACHNMEPAITAVNVQREVGHQAAKVLNEVCTKGYERAKTEADVQRLNDGGCVDAAFALKHFRLTHGLVVSMMQAYEAGRCTSVVNQAARECNLTEALANFIKAAEASAAATKRIEALR